MSKEERLIVEYSIGDTTIKISPNIVKEYITGGVEVSNQEYKLFTELCKINKLNPFLGEVHLIKYSPNSPAQMVVGKDVFLQRAGANENYNGRQQGVIVETKDGEIIERIGTFHKKDEKLVGGWAKVFRKDQGYPTYITVNLDEVAQRKKDGDFNSNWTNKPATMVEKVALVRALREAFPKDIRHMYEQDELWDNDPRQSVTQTTKQKDTFDSTTGEILDAEVETISFDDVKA